MEIITVGREPDNNVVINDIYVGRRHLEIIHDDQGIFILRELNAKNGTFVNGQRVNGDVYLNNNDIVRIGNTTLPWKSYFMNKEQTTTSPGGNKLKIKKERKPFDWRGLIAIISTIVGLIMMIFMVLRMLKII